MAVVVTIGGIDRTSFCNLRSIQITDTIVANADTMDLEVGVSTTDGWHPEAANQITVSNGTSKEFGGVIEDIYEELKSPSRLRYRLNCRDYTYLFDKYLVVDESTATLSADTWVNRIISSFTTGFTHVNVMAGPTLAAQKFDYVAPSEAVRSLADRSGYGWYIDYDKDVHFFAAATLAAPVASLDLEADTSNYGDLRLRETVSGVKDRVYMKDYKHKTSAQWNRAFIGDGNTRFFLLGQEPASIDSSDISADINGTPLDFLTDFIDGSPGTAVGASSQAFICYDNSGVRFSSGVSAMTSTQTLSVTFKYMQETVSQVQSLAAQAELASREGGDGVHEWIISDPQMTASDGSDDLAQLQGALVLARYALPRITGSFDSFTQGWRAGQSFVMTTTKRLGGFTETMFVQQVTKRIVTHAGTTAVPILRSTVEFADGVIGV